MHLRHFSEIVRSYFVSHKNVFKANTLSQEEEKGEERERECECVVLGCAWVLVCVCACM